MVHGLEKFRERNYGVRLELFTFEKKLESWKVGKAKVGKKKMGEPQGD